MEILMEAIPLNPQPRMGAPFRIAFANRGPEYWYNERVGWAQGGNQMLFEWKCPLGPHGKPVWIGGMWYWVPTNQAE